MTETFPQYAKTSHPDVIEAIIKAQEDFDQFLLRGRELSRFLTGDENRAMYRGNFLVGAHMAGLKVTEKQYKALPGQWKKWRREGITVEPYKNNPIMERLRGSDHPEQTIPGRRTMEWGVGFMGPGALFVHEGVAYSWFRFELSDQAPKDMKEYGWEEIKGSEFLKAKEDYEESYNKGE